VDSLLEIGWFFRVDKDDSSNYTISTMRSNLMELFTEPFSPKLYLDAINRNKPNIGANSKSGPVPPLQRQSSATSVASLSSVPSNSLMNNNNEFIAQQSYFNGLFRTKLRELLVDNRVPTFQNNSFGFNYTEAYKQEKEIVSLFIPKNFQMDHYLKALEFFRMLISNQRQQWEKQQKILLERMAKSFSPSKSSQSVPSSAFVFQFPSTDEKIHLKNKLTIELKKDGRILLPGNLTIYPGCNPYDLYQEFQALNPEQKVILQKMIHINDYLLLWGLPGTGKTTLLALAIRILMARNETILLTSYTHNAINHLLEKLLLKNCSIQHLLRIGNHYQYLSASSTSTTSNDLHQKIINCTLETSSSINTIDALSEKLTVTRVYFTTILNASKNKILKTLKLTYCIIDEAGQITEPLTIGGLLHSEKFILVGDDYQLSPLILNKESASLGMNVSLLKRLMTLYPFMSCSLTTQYRMNESIMSLCNELIYENKMSCGNESVAKGMISLPQLEKLLWNPVGSSSSTAAMGTTQKSFSHSSNSRCDWLYLSLLPENRVVYLNTDSLLPRSNSDNNNNAAGMNEVKINSRKESVNSGGSNFGGSRTRNMIEASIIEIILKGLSQVQQQSSPLPAHSSFTGKVKQEGEKAHPNPQKHLPPHYHVTILTPFRAQVQLLQNLFSSSSSSLSVVNNPLPFTLEVCTIDKYQGKDSDIVILSFVLLPDSAKMKKPTTDNNKPNNNHIVNNHIINNQLDVGLPVRNPSLKNESLDLEDITGNILRDWRRINVALTRYVTPRICCLFMNIFLIFLLFVC
jgi:GTPase SAR1 family protein